MAFSFRSKIKFSFCSRKISRWVNFMKEIMIIVKRHWILNFFYGSRFKMKWFYKILVSSYNTDLPLSSIHDISHPDLLVAGKKFYSLVKISSLWVYHFYHPELISSGCQNKFISVHYISHLKKNSSDVYYLKVHL